MREHLVHHYLLVLISYIIKTNEKSDLPSHFLQLKAKFQSEGGIPI